MSKYVVYQDSEDEWRWCFVSDSDRILVDSSEAYSSRIACQIALGQYRDIASNADVEDKKKKGRPRDRSRKKK